MCALLIPRSSCNESEEAPSIGCYRYTRSMTLSPSHSVQKADIIQRTNRDDCGFFKGSFSLFILPNSLKPESCVKGKIDRPFRIRGVSNEKRGRASEDDEWSRSR